MSIFKWHSESTVEIELPPSEVWEYCLDFDNWAMGDERFESFSCNEELKQGVEVRGKIKGRDALISIFVTNFQKHERFETFVKVPFFKQEASFTIEEVSTEKTRLKSIILVTSPFAFLMRKFLQKRADIQNSLFLKRLHKMSLKYNEQNSLEKNPEGT